MYIFRYPFIRYNNHIDIKSNAFLQINYNYYGHNFLCNNQATEVK